MSRFVKRSTARFELGDGDWVDLLERLAYGDRQEIEKKLFRQAIGTVPATSSNGEPKPATPKIADQDPKPAEVELDTAAANLELLRIAVVAWGGPGFCSIAEHPHDAACIPMPITVENLAQLDETGEKILNELQRRMVKPKRDFSRSRSRDTSTAAAAARTRRGSSS